MGLELFGVTLTPWQNFSVYMLLLALVATVVTQIVYIIYWHVQGKKRQRKPIRRLLRWLGL